MSTRRDLIYRMTADPEGFKKGMREAGQDSNQFWRELKKLEKQQKAVDDLMTGFGQGMLITGAAVAAGLGLAAKAAIEWESAWTGVLKVVDGSPEQMSSLEEELRGLATTLPQTHAEIAGVAAAAGQLGIARQDIARFTETMVAMGVATDLSSQDAAMGMARLMNIMQTAPDQVANLGSAIVGLGNAGASTESEIMAMALRIAGAGHTVGMTEAEVLAFSSALASVGIEAESGGSSVSTAMVKISEAVNEGGDSLEAFATIAGVTADEFASKFRSDPAAAIDMFVQGLGRIQSSGGDVFATLESVGMTEIRLRDALLRLAGAGDLLTDSLATGNEAWDENEALMAEAERRYGTTEAQMQIARNQLVDMGISLGEILLPALNKLLNVGDGLFSWFQSLPGPVQQTAVWLGVAAAAVTLIGGAALVAVPKLHALNVALGEMGGRKASMAKSALSGLAGFMFGPWGAAIGVAVFALGAFAAGQAEAKAQTDDLASTLDQQTGAVTDNTRAMIAKTLQDEGAFDMASKLGVSQAELVDAIITGSDAFASSRQEVTEWLDAVIEAGGVVGDLNEGQKEQYDTLSLLDGIMSDQQGTFDDAVEQNENLRAAVDGGSDALNAASEETKLMASSLGISTQAAQSASESFDDLDEKIRALIDSAFALNGAQRDVEAGIDALTESLEENGATVDRNSEAGRENEQAVEDQVAAIAQLALTTAEQTGSTEKANAVLEEERQRLIDVMQAAGFTSEEIDSYISVLDAVPGEINTAVRTSGLSNAIDGARSLGAAIHNVPSYKRVVIQYSEEGRNAPSGDREFADGGIVGYADGGIPGFPGGGLFRGRGGPRSDSNIIAVSDGEFIVNASSTERHRALLEAINSGRSMGAMSRSTVRAPMGSGGGTVNVTFDFANVSDSMARALEDTVRVRGNGNVQAAFGSR